MKTFFALFLLLPSLSWGIPINSEIISNQLSSLLAQGLLMDKEKAEFIVRREEYFDSTRYIVDVTKVIEIEDVGFLTFL